MSQFPNQTEVDDWFRAKILHQHGMGDDPGDPPVDPVMIRMVTAWAEILADLEKLPPPFLDVIADDPIDPDDRSVFYSSEGHTRLLCHLREVRAMARVVRAIRRMHGFLMTPAPDSDA